jgi:hypothetical protein
MQVTKMKMPAVKSQNHEAASDAGQIFALMAPGCNLFITIRIHSKIIFI